MHWPRRVGCARPSADEGVLAGLLSRRCISGSHVRGRRTNGDRGKRDDETRSASVGVIHPGFAAVLDDQVVNDSEADSVSRGTSGCFRPRERAPYRFAIRRRDAASLVGHGNERPAVLARHADVNRLTLGAVLHSVVEKVYDDVPESVGVHSYRGSISNFHYNRCLSRRGEWRELVDYSRDFAGKIDGGRGFLLGAAKSGEAQHVLHEIAQPRRLPVDMGKRPFPLFGSLRPSESQSLQVELDLRERRAELMRDARHEVRAHPGQLALAPDLSEGDERQRGRDEEQAEHERQARPRSTANDEAARLLGPYHEVDQQRPERGGENQLRMGG